MVKSLKDDDVELVGNDYEKNCMAIEVYQGKDNVSQIQSKNCHWVYSSAIPTILSTGDTGERKGQSRRADSEKGNKEKDKEISNGQW